MRMVKKKKLYFFTIILLSTPLLEIPFVLGHNTEDKLNGTN